VAGVGAHGKDQATIRHALTHTVGVPGLPADTTPEDVCNWQKMCAVIADEEPWWEPGTKTGYHAYTFGYIVDEVVRRPPASPSPRSFARRWPGRWGSPASPATSTPPSASPTSS
jgi:CubicO group peptidase (beta-lactamase class C family)